MSRRREVRVAESFFEELDLQLGPDRGPAGEPSATDFILIDLPRVVSEFATRFEQLPAAIPGVESIRMLIGLGSLTVAYVVHGSETADGVVHLVSVEIDP